MSNGTGTFDDSKRVFLDPNRSACLCDVGAPGYLAATCIDADGSEHLVVACDAAVGTPAGRWRAGGGDVPHEQLGALPIEFVRRLTISRRTHRCGRPTQAGRPCRNRVPAEGDACDWHRTKAER
jgi:hypothetical protein